MSILENPYKAGRPISDLHDFFGRTQDFRFLYQLLLNVESVNIIGSRRIGKTSLLNVIPLEEMQQKFLGDRFQQFNAQAVFAALDMQSQKTAAPVEFLSRLAEQLHIHAPDVNPQIQSYRDFEKILEHLKGADKRIFIVLDEFGSVADNEHFTVEFYDMLRYYQQHYLVSYLAASVRGVKDVAKSAATTSEFFNIFRVLRVGLLTDEDASELICKDRSLTVDVPFVKLIAGRHPFFIALLCFHLFDAQQHETDLPTDKRRENVVRRFVEEAFDHFGYYWEHLSNEERDVLKRLADRETVGEAETPELISLEQKALLAEQDGKYTIFSSAFEGFVKELEFSKTTANMKEFLAKNTKAIVAIGKYCLDRAVDVLKK